MAAGAANHNMSNLETFLAQWRQTFAETARLTPETLDELESHLRERIEQLIRSGLPEPEACQRAATELGNPGDLAAEFRKLSAASWLPVKIVSGVAIVLTLAVPALLIVRPFSGPGAGLLLSVHVFTVILGYASALLLGVLGACFVLQRAFEAFPPSRLAALPRVTSRFATVGTICTALGIFLGMIWARVEWGRFWGWDSKEIGGLAVIVWMLAFLLAHRFQRITPRTLLVATLLGSNVVLLAWFGPSFTPGLHASALPHAASLALIAAFIFNLLLTVLGLTPTGCLRLRKT
jgi:hypothetical protein